MKLIKVALNFDFETEEQFSDFCDFLADHGYRDALNALGEQLLKEAERRNMTVSPAMVELQKRVHA